MIIQVIKFKTADGSLWDTFALADAHEQTLSKLHRKKQMRELALSQNILKNQRRVLSQKLAILNHPNSDWSLKNELETELMNVLHSIHKNTQILRIMHSLFGHTQNLRNR